MIKSYDDKDYPDLPELVKMVCVLSLGNANLERWFSINKECIVCNQQKDSCGLMWMEAINTVGGVKKVPIAKRLTLSVKNSQSMKNP